MTSNVIESVSEEEEEDNDKGEDDGEESSDSPQLKKRRPNTPPPPPPPPPKKTKGRKKKDKEKERTRKKSDKKSDKKSLPPTLGKTGVRRVKYSEMEMFFIYESIRKGVGGEQAWSSYEKKEEFKSIPRIKKAFVRKYNETLKQLDSNVSRLMLKERENVPQNPQKENEDIENNIEKEIKNKTIEEIFGFEESRKEDGEIGGEDIVEFYFPSFKRLRYGPCWGFNYVVGQLDMGNVTHQINIRVPFILHKSNTDMERGDDGSMKLVFTNRVEKPNTLNPDFS